jgi:ABC-type antimicrobial peptide transport system permease subunit
VVYVPQLSRSLAVRLALGVRPPIAALRARISELEPPGSAIAIAPFGEDVTAALTPVRTAAILLLALGAMGSILACAGLYAVVSYAAEQRSFEIGMRMAFGATPGRIARMIVRDGLRITTTGCILGGAASWAIGRIVQSAIAGQAVFTPASLLGVAAVLAVIAVGASLGPAYRAGRADPVRALRQE